MFMKKHYPVEGVKFMLRKVGFVLVSVLTITVWMPSAVSHAQDDPATLTREQRAEIRFLEGMIDHHQMALDMANDCLEKAETEAVLELCQAVIDAQTPEIEQMRMWLLDWYNILYVPISMTEMMDMDGMSDMEMGHEGMGHFSDPAMMMGMMAGFNRLEGIDYEIAWLESMIDHHDDALHMSERILARAVHPELTELAENIIKTQSAEIEYMETLIVEMRME